MEIAKLVLEAFKSCVMSLNVNEICTIISVIVTCCYVRYTKGILVANKESADAARTQLEQSKEQQERANKIALFNDRVRVYAKWIKLIEDAKSDNKIIYTVEEKKCLLVETKYLFGKEIENNLSYYLDNYEKYCALEKSAYECFQEGKPTISSDEEMELYNNYKSAVKVINNLLESYLEIE